MQCMKHIINLLLRIGIQNIRSYMKELAQLTREFGLQKGLQIIGPEII